MIKPAEVQKATRAGVAAVTAVTADKFPSPPDLFEAPLEGIALNDAAAHHLVAADRGVVYTGRGIDNAQDAGLGKVVAHLHGCHQIRRVH